MTFPGQIEKNKNKKKIAGYQNIMLVGVPYNLCNSLVNN